VIIIGKQKTKKNMKTLLKLTSTEQETILIGVNSIISVQEAVIIDKQGNKIHCTKIYSRSAMASSYWVLDSVESIYEQYESYNK
jgi:hypothetical protein